MRRDDCWRVAGNVVFVGVEGPASVKGWRWMKPVWSDNAFAFASSAAHLDLRT